MSTRRRAARQPGTPALLPGATVEDLMAAISDVDKEIAAHQDILRRAALTVYRPLVSDTLERIQKAAAEQQVPLAVIPETIKGIPLGAIVTVSQSPAEPAVVIGTRRNTATGKPEFLLLVRGKGIVTASEEEVTLGAPSSTPEVSLEVSSPGPLPPQPENVASPTSHGSIHAGDMVNTPLGPGRVTAEPVPGGTLFRVDVREKDVYQFNREELTVVPPGSAAAPKGFGSVEGSGTASA